MKDELRFRAAGVLGQGLLGGLFTTLRVRIEGKENLLRLRREGRPVVFVLWHGQLLPMVHVHRGEGVVVLVSEHTDGEYITRVLERHGFGTARGSSTRGGIKGLKALIRAARQGHDLALTPDGPRGPARRFKSGALVAAQVTGLPVLPVAAGATSAWRFRSWDSFMVPRPLSVLNVEYGEPVHVPREADRDALDAIARRLEATLNAMTGRVGGAAADDGSPGKGDAVADRDDA